MLSAKVVVAGSEEPLNDGGYTLEVAQFCDGKFHRAFLIPDS